MSDKASIEWTDEQRTAIEATGRNVLVSAAAGSGKTAVLAERCAFLVCDRPRDQCCPVDRLLVVTFTEAAAAEMRTRIAAALRQRLGAAAAGRWAQRQLTLLDAARISTVHAFCHRLVRDHFAEAETDPNATLVDADEAALLERETLDALFDELYGRSDDTLADGFRRLVDDYGLGDDQRIAEFVLGLYRFTSSLVDPDGWLGTAAARLDPDAADAFDVVDRRRAQLSTQLDALAAQAAAHARAIRRTAPQWDRYADLLDADHAAFVTWLDTLRQAESDAALDDLMQALTAHKFSRAPTVSANERETDPEGKDRAHALLNEVRGRFKKHLVARLCRFTIGELREGLAAVAPYGQTIAALVQAFAKRYAARKQDAALLDFNDLERLALKVLSADGDANQPSEIARRLRDRFEHVLVDEFQDTNPLQVAILGLVSRESDEARPGNLFIVGDNKQSIYRFRLAEPTLFLKRLEQYRSAPAGTDSIVYLRRNFRSRANIIDAINAVFAQLMTGDLAGIAYDDDARLVHPSPEDDPPAAAPAVTLHVLERNVASDDDADDRADADAAPSPADLEAIDREAHRIGLCIREMRSADPTLRYRDMVILLRAPRHKATGVARVLRALDIPAFADAGAGYFEASEVSDMLNLLRVLDNRRQDIPLAAVLRSPVLGSPVSDADLVAVRSHGHRIPFHEAVVDYARHGDDAALAARLADVLARLDDFRAAATRQPLADVLWRFYEATGYLAYVGGLPGGEQRRANLLRLHERARQFGRFERQGLHRFLRFIEQIQDQAGDFGTAPTLSEADDVVRIMSIHKSKGLEFPVVILADLGKGWNFLDTHADIIFDRDEGLGLRVVDPERNIKYTSLCHQLAADRIKRESLREELRLLYVALTRARARLILVGTAKLDAFAAIRESTDPGSEAVSAATLATADSALAWFTHALAAQPAGSVAWDEEPPRPGPPPLFAAYTHDAEEIRSWAPAQADPARRHDDAAGYAALAPLPATESSDPADPAVDAVVARMTTHYEPAPLTTLPAVVAASEMKRRFDLLSEPDARSRSVVQTAPRWERPTFLSTDAAPALSHAERGTATHLVLEHVDLTRPCTEKDLRRQRDDMVARGVLEPAQASAVAIDALAWFFATDLGQRLRAADPDAVRREVMFVSRTDPSAYDPDLSAVDHRDTILVRGIIDCLLRTDAGWEIIDYKTDDLLPLEIPARAAAYAKQLDLYAQAVEAIWNAPVTAKRLVFLRPRVIQEVP